MVLKKKQLYSHKLKILQLLNNNPIYRLLIPKPVRTFFWKKFLSSKLSKL
ncbi:MAG: hypothetical protein CM15mP22_0510 [Gammaproteobacteria bacterium]|nr:MAG: hypothetical protein CM15mP22_0510 [Gammaproteobacteria bacterium]